MRSKGKTEVYREMARDVEAREEYDRYVKEYDRASRERYREYLKRRGNDGPG